MDTGIAQLYEDYDWDATPELDNLEDVLVEGIDPKITYTGRLTNNSEPDYREEGDNTEEKGITFVYFFGIPYAKPPLGNNRFKPPRPFQTNLQTYEALTIKPRAIQERGEDIVGSEDCLYLNIYLPKKPKEVPATEKLPVMVYIHGGGLFYGSGNYNDITPEFMMKEEIILVTVNYRLGESGFLNMHTEYCRGNAGLKDQVMALRWVMKNIEAFGGNPDNVTICGQSAGAACVNFHLISPLSRTLFQKAIVQSGGIYCPWGLTGHQCKIMRNFQMYADHEHANRYEATESLLKMDPKRLVQLNRRITKEMKMKDGEYNPYIHLGPSIETGKGNPEAFISGSIDDLMKQANPVPVLAGIAEQEGYSLFCDGIYKWEDDMVWLEDDEQLSKFVGMSLKVDQDAVKKNLTLFRKAYFPTLKKMNREERREHLATLTTDMWFRRFYENFKFLENTPTPLYVYKFNFTSKLNRTWHILDKDIEMAGHSDDIDYIFCQPITKQLVESFSSDIFRKRKTLCNLWANFCKTGVPRSDLLDGVEWGPHTEQNPCYLQMDDAKFELVKERLFPKRWEYLSTILAMKIMKCLPSPSTPMSPGGPLEVSKEDIQKEMKGVAGPSRSSSSDSLLSDGDASGFPSPEHGAR